MSDYWTICIEEGFAECGIKATKEQIDWMVGAVEGGHENYGMSHGYDAIPRQTEIEENNEIKRLKREIKELKNNETALENNIKSRYHPSRDVYVEVRNGVANVREHR
jgi:hypothetical protein